MLVLRRGSWLNVDHVASLASWTHLKGLAVDLMRSDNGSTDPPGSTTMLSPFGSDRAVYASASSELTWCAAPT